MNKSILIKVFSTMFPGVDAVEINLIDATLTTKSEGKEPETKPLALKDVESNVSLLKDYLNLKDNINVILIDMQNSAVHVIHTNGTKNL